MFYASQIGLQRVYDRICHYHQTCRKLCIMFIKTSLFSHKTYNFFNGNRKQEFCDQEKKQILDYCKKKKMDGINLSYKLIYMCMYTMKWGGGEWDTCKCAENYLFHYQHTAYTGFRILFWRNLRRTMCHLPSGPTMYLRAKCESSCAKLYFITYIYHNQKVIAYQNYLLLWCNSVLIVSER